MSKQAKPIVVEVPVDDPERQEELIMERCTFADNQKAVPVGILFNRPNFEGK